MSSKKLKVAKVADHRCSACGADFTKVYVYENAVCDCFSKFYWDGQEWECDDLDIDGSRNVSYTCSECGAVLKGLEV